MRSEEVPGKSAACRGPRGARAALSGIAKGAGLALGLALGLGLAAAGAGSLAHAAPPASTAATMCLLGGQVVDPTHQSVSRADVVIDGDRITRVGPEAGAGCAGRTIDVRGKFVMPGLIDLHVHLEGNPSPTEVAAEDPGIEATMQLVLRTGLMDMLDLAPNPSVSFPLRDKLRGALNYPGLRVAAVIFLSGRSQSADQDRALVRKQAGWRPDVLKVIPFDSPSFGATLGEASKLGIKTVVHINTWEEARAAVEAGATVITHFQDSVVIPDELVRLMAARHTLLLPTLAVQCEIGRLSKTPALLDDPLLAQVTTPALRQQYRQREQYTDKARRWVRWQQSDCVANDFVSLRKLRDAHVTFLAGSDTGNLGTFQGYSTHRELELMAEAGLSPWDTLRAATTRAAEFLGIKWGIGAGLPANLLVLDGSPVDSISNTRRIARVIYRGRLVVGAQP